MDQTETQTGSVPREMATRDALTLTVVHHRDRDVIGARRVIAPGARLVLGRDDATCALPGAFDDGRVSRRHAELVERGGALFASDLGSRNGTLLDGVPLTSPTLVAPGSTLALGDVVCLVDTAPLAFRRPSDPDMVGVGPALAALLDQVRRVAKRPTPVLVVGEMGSGKELVARALHRDSGRRGPLVALNCAGVDENLITSELFGHARGAFTDARTSREGLIGRGRGGTLFLDELADAPARFQATLLRFLETGRYRPVGADAEQASDIRLVAATQPRITELVADERFRPDLWSRLSRFVMVVPPLRERKTDIPLLARHFLARAGGDDLRMSPALVLELMRRPWPGNVRELAAAMERGVIGHDGGDVLEPGPWLEPAAAVKLPGTVARRDTPHEETRSRRKSPTPRPPREVLEAALAQHDGRVKAAADALGVARRTLYRWLDQLAIPIGGDDDAR